MTRRGVRLRALALTSLVAPLAALTGLAVAPSYAADTPATIDHVQPVDGSVQLLVTVPGTGALTDSDLAQVRTTIGGKAVATKAVPASESEAIARTSILAIDTSDSMRGPRITEAKRAALTYLAAAPANVRVGVLTFDDTVRLRVQPTTDRNAARAAIGALTLTHNTALYQGLLGAIDAAGPGGTEGGQRRILVLSDGKDTTHTPLDQVLGSIKSSGLTVDAVALQQSDAESGPLREIAAAGKGKMLNALQPSALSAAFSQEAAALGRQMIVTAQVPAGASRSSDVKVEVPLGGSTAVASAYVAVKAKVAKSVASATPQAVAPNKLAIPHTVVLGGLVAMGIGLLGVVLALSMKKPADDNDDRIADQLRAYGVFSTPQPNQLTNAQAGGALTVQAKAVAEKALANNRTLEAKVAAKLEAAGMSLRPAEWLLLRGGLFIAFGLVGLIVGTANVLLGVLLFLGGLIGPWLYLRIKHSKRLNAFARSLPDTLQLMAGSLSAGLSLAQSVDTIVREGHEPITSEFKRVVVESRLGVPLEDSLEGVGDRMQSRDFAWVVMAIRIQRDVGGNLAELLLSVADTLREREYLRRQVRALSAEGRLSCYVLGGLPPLFMAYLALTKPDYVHPMYSTPIGWAMVVGIVILLSVGVFWMTKVSKVEL